MIIDYPGGPSMTTVLQEGGRTSERDVMKEAVARAMSLLEWPPDEEHDGLRSRCSPRTSGKNEALLFPGVLRSDAQYCKATKLVVICYSNNWKLTPFLCPLSLVMRLLQFPLHDDSPRPCNRAAHQHSRDRHRPKLTILPKSKCPSEEKLGLC